MENLESHSEIIQEIASLEKEGFSYLQEWQMGFYAPDRFEMPSGIILDEKELATFFNKTKLKFGNKSHLEITKTLRYQELINSEEYDETRLSYPSFIDNADEFNCMRKYHWKAKVSLF